MSLKLSTILIFQIKLKKMTERKEFIIHKKNYIFMFQREIFISYFEEIQKVLNKLLFVFPNLLLFLIYDMLVHLLLYLIKYLTI